MNRIGRVKQTGAVLLSLLLIGTAAGCSKGQESPSGGSNVSSDANSAQVVSVTGKSAEQMFSAADKDMSYDESKAVKITLADGGSAASSSSVKVTGNTVTVTDGGTYLLSGSLTNGQVIVDAEKTDAVKLVLHGASITCNGNAALYVKQADQVAVALADGTQNALTATGEFPTVADEETHVDAALFAKDRVVLGGGGSLTVTAEAGHGVTCKDDLLIVSGTYAITAGSHALEGKDSVRIAGGELTLTAGKDGIHAENAEDATKGYIYIAGGTATITADGDGMDAASLLQVEDGTVAVTAGGGHTKNAIADVSSKGLKATGDLLLQGGTVTVDAADDALHANGNVAISGGAYTLASGDDGVHADSNTAISDGTVTITDSYEGIEGQSIDISGGEITLKASDDGLNAAGGNDQNGFGGFGGRGQDMFAADANSYVRISGGKLHVDAAGDGLDSNGNLYVSGGEIYVAGPTNSGNGALDYNGSAEISGGVLVAVGASGMAQNFGESSTQGSIMVTFSGSQSGTVRLKTSGGEELISFTPGKAYNSVVVSCPQLKTGETYTVETDADTVTVEMSNLIVGSGGMGGMGGPGGMRDPNGNFGGENGERPNRPEGGFGGKGNRTPPDGMPEGMPDGQNTI